MFIVFLNLFVLLDKNLIINMTVLTNKLFVYLLNKEVDQLKHNYNNYLKNNLTIIENSSSSSK